MKRKISNILALIFFTSGVYSQSLEVRAYIESQEGKAIDGATAEVYVEGNRKQSVKTDSKGFVSFELAFGNSYKVIVSKAGMIQKRIDFVANVPADKQRNLVKEFAMTLVEDCEGANTSVFKDPVDVVKFDDGFGNFVSDQSHVDNMRTKIASAYASIDKCKKDKYQEKKTAADKAFKEGDFTEAEKLYQEALEVFPNDSYAKRQISQSRKGQEKQIQNLERYENLLNEGDQFLAQNQLSAAQQRYAEASKLNPSDIKVQAKIQEINQILAQKAQQQQQQQAINKEYDDVMTKANTAMASKNYALAKQLYEQAGKIKPNEAFPAQKLAMAQQAMAKEEEDKLAREKLEQSYQEAMASGQTALQQGDFSSAKQNYHKALALKPTEQLPKQKIQEIERLEEEKRQKELQAQRDELEINYNEAIQKADGLLTQKEFDASIDAYKQALQFKPTDKYAQVQINKAGNLKIEEEQNKQAEIEQAYLAAMNTGDAKKGGQLFEEAIEAYKQALVAKPNDPTANSKLGEAQKLLADQQRRNKEETELKARYNQLIQEGDSYFQSRNYTESKSKFQEALALYPAESYPKNKIASIDNIQAKSQKEAEYNEVITQADQLFNQQEFDQAVAQYTQAKSILPQKTYPQEKINEISKIRSQLARDQKQAEYDQLATKAEQKIQEESLEEAKSLYGQAMKILPENPFPQQRINEINQMISNKSKSATQDKYNELASQAEQQILQENFETAKSLYMRATLVIPENPYPNQRINEINEMISDKAKSAVKEEYNQLAAQAEQQVQQENYEEAKALYAKAQKVMPEETYPQQRINEINEMISNLSKNNEREEFENLKVQAEQEVNAENYNNAKSLLARAALILPEDPYPQKRINEINSLIDNKTKNQKFEKYNSLIQQADNLFNQKSFNEAKGIYLAAQKENTESDYPQQRINEINQIISQNARQKTEGEYLSEIAKADNYFNSKQYDLAVSAYTNASRILPEKTYPRQKINEINSLLSEDARLEREKLERKANYDRTIALANKFFEEKNYVLSRTEYNNALSIYPNEQYPANQLNKIEGLLSEQQRIDSEKRELERKFNEAVAMGDDLFRQKEFQDSKSYYEQALSLKSNDPHSSSQIKRINQIQSENMAEKERLAAIDARYKSIIENADVKFGSKDYKSARLLYYSALEVKPNEVYPRQQLKKIDANLKVLLASSNTKTSETAKTSNSSAKIENLSFKDDGDRANYMEQLKKDYKPGITQETYKEGNKTTNRYIVIRGDEVHEFRAVTFTWGGAEYSVDGKPTNSLYFKSQVKPREGESFTKVDM